MFNLFLSQLLSSLLIPHVFLVSLYIVYYVFLLYCNCACSLYHSCFFHAFSCSLATSSIIHDYSQEFSCPFSRFLFLSSRNSAVRLLPIPFPSVFFPVSSLCVLFMFHPFSWLVHFPVPSFPFFKVHLSTFCFPDLFPASILLLFPGLHSCFDSTSFCFLLQFYSFLFPRHLSCLNTPFCFKGLFPASVLLLSVSRTSFLLPFYSFLFSGTLFCFNAPPFCFPDPISC
jgi:hypothetical protein